MLQDIVSILPQILVLLTAVMALCFEMVRRPGGSFWTVVIGMAAAAGWSASRFGIETTVFSGTFRIDALSNGSMIILCPSTIICALLARAELGGSPREGTLYALLAFSTLASLILAGAGDIMFIVLGVLMNGLSGFALAAHSKSDPATEGALKYFIYGSVTGAFMVFGLAYWVGLSGDTTLAALGTAERHSLPYAFGLVALMAGVGYAASLFPFHFWTPDTFEGAPVSIAAFLSVIPKVGAIFAVTQVIAVLPADEFPTRMFLALLAAASMTFGNLVALVQHNLIRLLAYSTIAQTGYFLIGALAFNRSAISSPALIVFGLAYAAMNLGAFAVVLAAGRTLRDIEGFVRNHPIAAVALAVFLFSLVGIPPLAGFAGKFLLFAAALDAQFTWLAVVAILNSVLSLAVYLRIISPMFLAPSGHATSLATATPVRWSWSLCLAVTALGGLAVPWAFAMAGGSH